MSCWSKQLLNSHFCLKTKFCLQLRQIKIMIIDEDWESEWSISAHIAIYSIVLGSLLNVIAIHSNVLSITTCYLLFTQFLDFFYTPLFTILIRFSSIAYFNLISYQPLAFLLYWSLFNNDCLRNTFRIVIN